MSSPFSDTTPLPEDDAHRVLARAVELDSRAASEITVAQLKHIAGEAGIGAASLNRALEEWRHGRLSSPPRSGRVSFAERLRRNRGPAFLMFFIGAAGLTPGDVLVANLLYVLPAMALYELVIRAARGQSRSGPTSSPPSDQATARAHPARDTDHTMRIDALALRVGSIAPAV